MEDPSFGTFYTGSTGGTVTDPSIGSRQASGSVVLFPSDPVNPAFIRLQSKVDASITISTGVVENLSNGSGAEMQLQINDIYPVSPFMVSEGPTYNIYIGGTLTVGSPSTSPAGNYSGSFEIIFNQE